MFADGERQMPRASAIMFVAAERHCLRLLMLRCLRGCYADDFAMSYFDFTLFFQRYACRFDAAAADDYAAEIAEAITLLMPLLRYSVTAPNMAYQHATHARC